MLVENIRGVNIVYEIVGDRGPWVVLITGGRRAHDELCRWRTRSRPAALRAAA